MNKLTYFIIGSILYLLIGLIIAILLRAYDLKNQTYADKIFEKRYGAEEYCIIAILWPVTVICFMINFLISLLEDIIEKAAHFIAKR